MKPATGRRPITSRINFSILLGVLAVAVLAVPFYSVDSSSRGNTVGEGPVQRKINASLANTLRHSGWTSMLTLPFQDPGSVTLYAADCVTPKSSFSLGEVVCAKTDGVNLTVPNNYYMNWIDSQLNSTNGGTITQNPQYFLFSPPTADTWKATIGRVTPPDSSIIGNPPLFDVSADRPAIGVFAGDGAGGCTNTPKSVFNVQDTNKDVCAKVTGGQANQYILWSNARFELVQNVPLGTGENVFTLSSGSSLGDWRVILYEPNGGSVYAVTPFTVIDAANPSADLTISKSLISDTASSGGQIFYSIQVSNLGPSDAASVQVTDNLPAGTTFSSFDPISGAGFNCANVSGDVTCTIANLPRGESAIFLASYDVTASTGVTISNTAAISSTTDDPSSLNDSSTASITVTGTTAEDCTLTCPADVVVTADTTFEGEDGAFVTYGAAAGDGNCGAISNTPASGSFFTVGAHPVTSNAAAGDSCIFTVTVLDSNPPTISCPPSLTVQLTSGQTEANLTEEQIGTPTITASGSGDVTFVRSDDQPATYDDNGNVITPPVVHALTDPYQIGTTGITWTVTDAGGRTASCTQTITVQAAGARDPVSISCPANVNATAPEGSCEATVNTGTPTTNPSDNDVEVTSQRSDGRPLSDPFPGGTTQITWTAYDNITNTSASCVQTVTVTVPGDTTPPTFVDTQEMPFPPNINATTSSCTATIEDLGEAHATDSGACNSGGVSISRSGVPPGFVFPTGTTTIIYTATDGAGNQATRLQLVTVTESPAVPPTIQAPADVTAYTGPGATSCGTVVSDATLGTATAQDNCPGVTVTRTGVPAGNVFPVGNTTVTYTATDRSGNTANDTQVVTVVDNTVPVISCPADITVSNDPGQCSAIVNPGTATATDNCDSSPTIVGTRSDNQPLNSSYPVGTTTITWTATDDANNQSSCVQTITVNDTENPTITCPADITLEPTCPSGAIATYPAAVVADNCGVQSQSEVTSPTPNLGSGSVFPIGTTTVTRTVTDIHGNTASCSFTVTVKTALQTLADLRAQVAANQQLSPPQRNGLLSKLDAAKQHIENGNQNGACAKLADFVNSTQNFINNGSLSATTGNAWIHTANNIRNTIGCTNNPCT